MLAEALSAVGAVTSLFGGSKNKSQQPAVSGFAAKPQAAQDALLKTFLPAALEQYAKPREALPSMRAVDPATDPFASQALWELQQYRDRAAAAAPAPAPVQQSGISPDQYMQLVADQFIRQASDPGPYGLNATTQRKGAYGTASIFPTNLSQPYYASQLEAMSPAGRSNFGRDITQFQSLPVAERMRAGVGLGSGAGMYESIMGKLSGGQYA